MCCTRLAGNTGCKNDAKNRHQHTIAQLCGAESSQLSMFRQLKKNLLNSNIFSTCPHSIANFSPLAAEIGSGVWGTTYTTCIFLGSCPLTEFRHVQNPLCVQVLRCPILLGSVTARHSSTGHQPNFAALSSRGRHLYSAGRPSHWVLAHILVMVALWNRADHYIFILWFLSIYLLSSFFFLS